MGSLGSVYAGPSPSARWREWALRAVLLNLHKSFGLLLLGLALVRIALRAFLHPLPAVAELPLLARLGAAATHGLLYLLLLAVPVCGWLLANSHGKPAGFFGLFTLPGLVDIDEDLGDLTSELHETGAYLLLGLIGLPPLQSSRICWTMSNP